jgi:hypothetical protein
LTLQRPAEVSDRFRQFPARDEDATNRRQTGHSGGFRPFRPFRPRSAAGPAGWRAPHQRRKLTTEEDREISEVSAGRRETLVTKTLVTVSWVSALICRLLIMMPILFDECRQG